MKAQYFVDRLQKVINKYGNKDTEIEAYVGNTVPEGDCYRVEQPLWIGSDSNTIRFVISLNRNSAEKEEKCQN